jgi:hypothetical protein
MLKGTDGFFSVSQVHSNETVGSLRHKIAAKLSSSPDNVQIVVNDKVVSVLDREEAGLPCWLTMEVLHGSPSATRKCQLSA